MFLIAGLLVGDEKEVMNMTEEEMARAEGELRKLHENVRFYWSDQAEMEQAMASGEIVAAWGWMASVNNLTKNGVNVKFMAPKEGIMRDRPTSSRNTISSTPCSRPRPAST